MLPMYNACSTCGGTELVLFRSDERHKGVEVGTRCLVCVECKRFGSVDNWNRVNPKQEVKEQNEPA